MISDNCFKIGDLAGALLSINPRALENVSLRVTGWSMGSLLGPSALLRISRPAGMPAVGDIVLIRKGRGLLVHRVIARNVHMAFVVTKGDACSRADPPSSLRDVLGILIGIEDGRSLRIPSRMRFPWSVLMAWNSGMQDRFQKTFPRTAERWNVFKIIYTIWEKTERWIS